VRAHARTSAASKPPAGLPGLRQNWSRLVSATDDEGVERTWHVLDNGVEATIGTMLCVHGNPTWSYLWRRFLAEAPEGWRVVAVDQLGMGFSERPERARTLAQRIGDLTAVVDALDVTGPVVTAGHDWGGVISLGWALAHRDRVRAVVLANTAVHQPADAAAPSLIRLARTPALRHAICTATPTFVRVACALSRPGLPADVRDALAAPYGTAARRHAVGAFVEDIPLEAEHVSAPTLDGIAAGLPALADVPVLMLWGPRDPVFSDRYLRDLRARLPHAHVHRYERASHLVTEDAPDSAVDAWRWLQSRDEGPPPRAPRPADRPPVWAALEARAGDPAAAVVELADGRRTISFDLLERRVRELAAGLAATGVRAGERVALLVPPGADLTAAAYACWRAGAVVVLADAGLGPVGLARALRGAAPDHVIGVARGLALARLLGIPGRRILAGRASRALRRLLGSPPGLADIARTGRGIAPPPPVDPDAAAAVLFTSGATGPAKGVVYRHRQLQAQLDTLRTAYGITPDDRLVAAFPPFALYGPALGIASATPAARAPQHLTAAALATAAEAVAATVVFASPAALRGVVATVDGLGPTHRAALARIRLVVSAGAPVPAALLHDLGAVLPRAAFHTPYGMTEALPVTDVSLAEIDAAGSGDGVCVGRPLPEVAVRISPLSADGTADGPLTDESGVTGEVCVRAAHVKDHYDQLWATERATSRDAGWHRTGDVGHLDDKGMLWVEGRTAHVITTAARPVTPVGVEQRVEAVDGVTAAAVVGVGPRGAQQVVVVVVSDAPPRRPAPRLAPEPLADAVRAAAGVEVAAVLRAARLPVDIRHASKVDRSRVGRWAERVLAGGRAGSRP
jgi:acyl-CoA synthetase (AMP-forming)/AMP-acid ligase II/pimeloyl-ACP methyl ester carboxylesterase